jgi:hypothetical protein
VPDARCTRHQAHRRALLVGCISAFLGLVFGTLEGRRPKPFRAGRLAGEFLGQGDVRVPEPDRLDDRSLTMILPGIIISTQFSFGRSSPLSSRRGGTVRASWPSACVEERRREKQRREVIAKLTKCPRALEASRAAAVDEPAQRAAGPKRFASWRTMRGGRRAKRAAFGSPIVAPPKPPKVALPARHAAVAGSPIR